MSRHSNPLEKLAARRRMEAVRSVARAMRMRRCPLEGNFTKTLIELPFNAPAQLVTIIVPILNHNLEPNGNDG